MRNSRRSRNKPPTTVSGEAEGRFGTVLKTETKLEARLWQGPLPSPDTLEEFRAIVPDAPERIFRQWELEADHRRAFEKKALKGDQLVELLGMIFALIFALAALAFSGLALYWDRPWIAGIVGGGTIASVVTAFILGRSKKPNGQK